LKLGIRVDLVSHGLSLLAGVKFNFPCVSQPFENKYSEYFFWHLFCLMVDSEELIETPGFKCLDDLIEL
jgi:hypothetical protein